MIAVMILHNLQTIWSRPEIQALLQIGFQHLRDIYQVCEGQGLNYNNQQSLENCDSTMTYVICLNILQENGFNCKGISKLL